MLGSGCFDTSTDDAGAVIDESRVLRIARVGRACDVGKTDVMPCPLAGLWRLEASVGRTTCGDFRPGPELELPVEIGPLEFEPFELFVRIDEGGRLSAIVDTDGAALTSRSRIFPLDGDARFELGLHYDRRVGLRRLLIATGRLGLSGEVKDGSIERRDYGPLLDCSTTYRIVDANRLEE